MPVSKELELRFHGRVIEHLGIDMYQSPTAAIAELIANAWDADAEGVQVTLPDSQIDDESVILIEDDGVGMTFEECQSRYLNVGYNRRGDDPGRLTPGRSRPIMGRKGIGKFAGFGIAGLVEVRTISRENGELTTFELDIERLRGDGEEYMSTTAQPVEVTEYKAPSSGRRKQHGTTVTLRRLTLKRRPSAEQFRRSMARRFLLLERADDFDVVIDGEPLPESHDAEHIEFDFPTAYRDEERPSLLTLDGPWGKERLSDGSEIRWRVLFYEEPIDDEELAGVAVFAHGKMAQRPFLFNLSGGLGGQTGTAYISGQVQADFIDERRSDLIATERQRVNWESDATAPLLDWGKDRIKALLLIWKERRAEEKIRLLEERLAPFAERVHRLKTHERRVVERALRNIAKITSLTNDQFGELATSMLTAWEGGRLQELINSLGEANELDEAQLLQILAESNILTSLHAAEKVRGQLNLVRGLRRRIDDRELENAVRDYIAKHPWLVSPKWETFVVERRLSGLIAAAEAEAGLNDDPDWAGRIDLVLSASSTLLVMEFMRPGLAVDWDHVGRYQRYVETLREKLAASSSSFDNVEGLLVADKLERRTGMTRQIQALRHRAMDVLTWEGLLDGAESQWRDYLELLQDRAPDDERLRALDDPSAAAKRSRKAAAKKKQAATKKSTAKASLAKTPPRKASVERVAKKGASPPGRAAPAGRKPRRGR